MFKHTIVITGITLLSAFGAIAGTVTTHTANVTVTNTSGNALLQQFDPSLGTLTGIANLSLTTTESIPYTYPSAASGPGLIEVIVIGLAGLIWLARRRVLKALGRN